MAKEDLNPKVGEAMDQIVEIKEILKSMQLAINKISDDMKTMKSNQAIMNTFNSGRK